MASKRTFKILLSVIILVVLLVIIVATFVTPAQDIYDEKGILKITDVLISSGGSGIIVDMSVGINADDSQLVKIGKVFENFNPNLVYKKDVTGNRIYNKIIINGDDDIGVSDVTSGSGNVKKGLITVVKEALATWDVKNDDYEINCPDGISSGLNNNLNSNCWDTTFDGGTVSCAIQYDDDLGDTMTNGILKGKKTIRIMWIISENVKIKPLITICGE
ncbi:MAG: hypothetical protein KJ697_04215 [Nanoarchaeota archaeon]|nr:hypothetical protein [Nanoarchaeota archaeon]